MPNNPSDIFGETAFSYTQYDAFADGVLVDANIGDFAEASREHFPGVKIAMTAALFALIEKAVASKQHANDHDWVWYDILWMSKAYATQKWEGGRMFEVVITGTGLARIHRLKVLEGQTEDGQPALTFMLPGED